MDKTLLSILAGLGAMFGWGTSDFFANQSADKIGSLRTFFWSQIAGVILMGIVSLIMGTTYIFNPQLLALTFIAGITYAFAYLLFYRGFELGNVSVVSAVINFQNVFIIAISYFIFGQTVTAIQIPALFLVLIGIFLVSVKFEDLQKGEISLMKGVKETLLAAVMFGMVFWPMNEFVAERTDWKMTSFLVKMIALFTVFIFAQTTKKPLKIETKSSKLVVLIAVVGLLEAAAVISATFGQAYGDSIIVAPIASALTVVTVALAMIFSKEKISKIQGFGIALTICGIVMTAL
jgi:bacterial/archaeal transporter family protein